MTGLPPATRLRRRDEVRMLHLDPIRGALEDALLRELPLRLRDGDLLVLNDAATLPASLPARTDDGERVELRLLEAPNEEGLAWAMSYRAGSWRTRTEDRAPSPELQLGARLRLGASGTSIEILERSSTSERLVLIGFDAEPASIPGLIYEWGRPIQYSYLTEELPLWAVQTPFGHRPWAVEPPSAGLMLDFDLLGRARAAGARWATLTHGAGISSTGDPRVDARLPLAERYEIPARTAHAISEAKRRGGRILAIGTTVVRALEGAYLRGGGRLLPGRGRTSLRIGPDTRLAVIDGLLTGMHQPGESHYDLLRAFAPSAQLEAASRHAEAVGYLSHELGDCTLVWA